MQNTLGQLYWKEIESEIKATRLCLERFAADLVKWKPHDKSMEMGNLAIIVAEVPKWITMSLEQGEINFGTWERYTFTSTEDLVKHFDECIENVKKALTKVSDEDMQKMFYLKNKDVTLMSSTMQDNVSSCIRHWVHHRGQFTVYMRLNNIPVPSIYGPSADDKSFG